MSTSEESKPVRGGELALKIATLAIATIAAIIGWAQHQQNLREERDLKAREIQGNLDLRRDEYELKKIELSQPFWSRRADFCLLAAGAASRIAVLQGRDLKAIEDFWVLYWGPMAAVVGRGDPDRLSPEEAMVRYGDALNSCLQRPDEQCWEQLRICSLDVAQECTALLCEALHDKDRVDACSAAAAPRHLSCPPPTRQSPR